MSATDLRLIVEVEDARWQEALPDVERILGRSIGLALERTRSDGRPIEVGVRLVDDGTIQGLNRDWRGRDKPTNVLSFPLGAPDQTGDPALPWLIGDIVMGFDTVLGEAEAEGKPLGHHVAHLAIHAALHLTGHDHEGEAEAALMEQAEIALLGRLGIPDPYAERQAGGPV
ncbi:MAG TPA: rRNA maturation RNase YbeY [Alphaproteobacteria bacterium]|nr:rRNA maturation RNase YbeY [Alphaproteobacteria bacterium]